MKILLIARKPGRPSAWDTRPLSKSVGWTTGGTYQGADLPCRFGCSGVHAYVCVDCVTRAWPATSLTIRRACPSYCAAVWWLPLCPSRRGN
eukprot:688568-Pleurochrysis_carterae.AAC.1